MKNFIIQLGLIAVVALCNAETAAHAGALRSQVDASRQERYDAVKRSAVRLRLSPLPLPVDTEISDKIDPSAVENIIIHGDSEDNLEKPCKDSSDMTKCVQEFFKDLSRCVIPDHIDEDMPAMFKHENNVYVPVANMSYILTNTNISHLNGNIEDFYINHNTNNLVMTVEFKDLHVSSKDIKIIVARVSQEPKIVTTDARGTHHIKLTAVIPLENTITLHALRGSYISTYIPSYDVSKSYYGPAFTKSDDPAVAASAKAFFENVYAALQEYFLTAGPNVFIAYLQKYICNFGIGLPY